MKILLIILFIFPIISLCKSIPPDLMLNFTQYCTYHLYPNQEHQVMTEDGYILSIFRVQAKNSFITSNKTPVLIQHGLLQSSMELIIMEEAQTPIFILADQGYDVWGLNVRGNTYGLHHEFLNKTQPEFWDFSFQDMATYDLPAVFEYISNITGFEKFKYIGHSQGTLIMFTALSLEVKGVTQHLDEFIALSPTVYINSTTNSFLKLLADNDLVFLLLNMYKGSQILPYSQAVSEKLAPFCNLFKSLCQEIMQAILGGSTELVNYNRFDYLVAISPAGTSKKNLFHFQQLMRTGVFALYDYRNNITNMKHYNQTLPPEINLSNIKHAIHMVAGTEDGIINPKDAQKLYDQLKEITNVTLDWVYQGHSSMVVGNNMTYFYDIVLPFLNNTKIQDQ